jgi:NAD(P)-dependent dehydrogenase (short-subunit alcohol dehydrogenase family)
MAGALDGRVVIITGAGGGIGRAHALACAAEGAQVVVNDVGGARDGSGTDSSPAQQVADEIVAAGGRARVSTDDVADWDGARQLIAETVEHFGGLDVVVNNAGILRDRMLVNMSEQEWDAVIRVHLRGTFMPTRHAAQYWREESKAGRTRNARIINTSSASGLFGNAGQSNYGAAKAAIAGLTLISSAELARYGVTVNAVSPTALTRMTEGLSHNLDALLPADISPVVVWLASDRSNDVTGRVIAVRSGRISVVEGWVNGPTMEFDAVPDPEKLDEMLHGLLATAAPNASMSGTRDSGHAS